MLLARLRIPALLVLGLAVAACDTGDADPTSTEPAPEPPPSTTAVAGEILAYGFEPGSTHTYDVVLEQHIALISEGSAEAVGDEGVPGEVDVTVEATGSFVYVVSEGPEPGTFSLAIDGTFDDAAVTGTVDGVAVDDPADVEQLGVLQPVSTVVTVDGQGRVTADPDSSLPPVGLGATPLTGLGGDLSRWVGPVLSPEPVGVGSTWTETSVDLSVGDEPVETTLQATVTGTESVHGVDTVVIETETVTGQADIDLSEFFAGFLGAFSDPDDPAAQEALEEAVAQLVFRITIEPSTTEGTTWFDANAGLARRSVVESSPTRFLMDVAIPDDQTGELLDFTMDLSVTQSFDYTLVSG